MQLSSLILLLVSMLAPASRSAEVPVPPQFDHVEGSTIFFKTTGGQPSIEPLKTKLTDIEYRGELKADDASMPYFLFTGRRQDERWVYILRPDGSKPLAFIYPGKIVDAKTHHLAFQSRAFFGHCLSGHGDVYAVFQKERVERRRRARYVSSVYVAEAQAPHLEEKLIERRLPSLGATLHRVRRHECEEIKGVERHTMPKLVDLHPHGADAGSGG